MSQGRKVSQFIRISKEFGFNRHQLMRWRFGPESVTLHFTGGGSEVLVSQERETFRNWIESVGEAAPQTHQYSLFGAARNGDS